MYKYLKGKDNMFRRIRKLPEKLSLSVLASVLDIFKCILCNIKEKKKERKKKKKLMRKQCSSYT